MDFAFTEEQNQFRDVVARFCRDKSPSPTVRKIIAGERGFDPEVWQQMCRQLGLAALHVTEQSGGAGFGAVELGIVMEELGRNLMPVPYLSSVLATTALAQLQDAETRDPLMGAISGAERLATLVLDPRSGDPVSRDLTAADHTIAGTAGAVLDGASADLVLAIVADAEGYGLHAVTAPADGYRVRPLRTMDGTRRFAELRFDATPAMRLGTLTDTQVKRVYDTALVALANEMVGGARMLLDSTVEYAQMRVQFGRPIGSFQAIKHRLADLLVDVELATVAAHQAAAALAAGEDVSVNASLAKFTASDAYMNAAREAIQLRGGIGFTWENDTHLWYRRAKSSEVFLGTPAFHRERMIQELTA